MMGCAYLLAKKEFWVPHESERGIHEGPYSDESDRINEKLR